MEEKERPDLKWILMRNGKITNIFENRKEGVSHLKKLLKQTLKDYNEQDKIDYFDYPIELPEIKIIPVEERDKCLGL